MYGPTAMIISFSLPLITLARYELVIVKCGTGAQEIWRVGWRKFLWQFACVGRCISGDFSQAGCRIWNFFFVLAALLLKLFQFVSKSEKKVVGTQTFPYFTRLAVDRRHNEINNVQFLWRILNFHIATWPQHILASCCIHLSLGLLKFI